MDAQSLTPIERRLMVMLSTGHRIPVGTLRTCLNDDLATIDAFRAHIKNLRNKLRPTGEDVALIHLRDGTYYQLINLTAGGNGTS